jgi:NAD(P)-dependent dehydrogenase (short-subunit alcohol dehydrogenase family)
MNIVVTGCSRGIGFELVRYLSKDPENHIFAISRNERKLIKLKDHCLSENLFDNVTPVIADLTEPGVTDQLTEFIKGKVQRIDALVNNAGFLVNKPFEDITFKDLLYVYNTNVFAPFQLIQSLVPLMGGSRSHIVNIGSMGGVQGTVKFPGLSAYSSSKAALAGLTECLAIEFQDRDIAVNCLALGAVQTEMLQEAFPGFKAPVSPERMAEFIGHFVLTGHHFMNGKVIPVSLSTP